MTPLKPPKKPPMRLLPKPQRKLRGLLPVAEPVADFSDKFSEGKMRNLIVTTLLGAMFSIVLRAAHAEESGTVDSHIELPPRGEVEDEGDDVASSPDLTHIRIVGDIEKEAAETAREAAREAAAEAAREAASEAAAGAGGAAGP